jgi:hypothetical protein
MKDHRNIDARSLAFGRAIADRLITHPELIDQARHTLKRWMATCSSRSKGTLEEWRSVLDGPVEEVVALLTDAGERATRLRQSNPFAGLLPEAERNEILRQFEAYDAAGT